MENYTFYSCFLIIVVHIFISSSEIHNGIRSEDFAAFKASKEIVVISFIRSKPYDNVFQRNFKEAGDYLEEFGVNFGNVDCLSDPVTEYCSKPDAALNVYVFRHGSFFLTLAYDTLFGVDAIVSNILHLVLLVDVPIISDDGDLQALQDRNTGKTDLIFGFIPAIGTHADRAFMEVAFAYRHQYAFLTTTSRELMDETVHRKGQATGSDLSQMPSPQVVILQCSRAGAGHTCPKAQYQGPITTESLALMMKTLGLPAVIDLTESGNSNPYKDYGVSAVYAITDPEHHKQALSLVMETKTEFRGNLGFVIVNRDDVAMIDLDLQPDSDSQCIPACFALRGIFEDFFSGDIRDASQLRAFIQGNMPLVFSHLANPAVDVGEQHTDTEGGDEDDGDELPEQERQDDPVQEATVHLRLALKPKESPIPSLNDKTFPQFTGQSQLTSILFTMKWNPRSLAFVESFESAAQSIMALFSREQDDSPLAQVECSNWPDVCDKSNVTAFPTVKMYREQTDVATYGGILDKENVLKSYLLLYLPSPLEISSEADMMAFIQGSFPAPWIGSHLANVVLAIIPDGLAEERAVFKQVAQELKGEFLLGLCSTCVQQKDDSSQSRPSVTLYKWNDPEDPEQIFVGDFTAENLQSFIKDASLPVLPELTAATMPTYLARGKPFVILFHAGDPISYKAAKSLREVAMDKNYNQFILCQMDISREDTAGSDILATYGFLPIPSRSTVVILDQGAVCRYPDGQDSSAASFKDWLVANQKKPGKCSESRAQIDHEWKPLVPPYDFLKFMEDEEHLTGHGRRGLKTHQDEEVVPDKDPEGEPRREKDLGERERQDRHSHRHVEL